MRARQTETARPFDRIPRKSLVRCVARKWLYYRASARERRLTHTRHAGLSFGCCAAILIKPILAPTLWAKTTTKRALRVAPPARLQINVSYNTGIPIRRANIRKDSIKFRIKNKTNIYLFNMHPARHPTYTYFSAPWLTVHATLLQKCAQRPYSWQRAAVFICRECRRNCVDIVIG